MASTRSRLSRARTQGTWEANGVIVQSPPEAEVQECIQANGWANRHVIATCSCTADAEFIALAVNCHNDLVSVCEACIGLAKLNPHAGKIAEMANIILAKARGE